MGVMDRLEFTLQLESIFKTIAPSEKGYPTNKESIPIPQSKKRLEVIYCSTFPIGNQTRLHETKLETQKVY